MFSCVMPKARRRLKIWLFVVFLVAMLDANSPVGTQTTSLLEDSGSSTSQPRLAVQLGHSGNVTSVAFAPDGRFILTGSLDATAVLWDAVTGVEVRRFVHRFQVWSVAFSPDGRFVLTRTSSLIKNRGDYVYIWNTATGTEVRRFEGHAADPGAFAFSPDGQFVLTADDQNTAHLWEVQTGNELRRFTGHEARVETVRFAPNGHFVLTGSLDKTARLWDAATGAELRRFEGHASAVNAIVFSPDAQFVLTGSSDTTARLWEINTGREVQRFEGHGSGVTSVAFSPDGRFVLTETADKTAYLWNTATGQEVQRFQEGTFAAFSPDSRMVTRGEYHKTAHLRDVATGQEVRQFPEGGLVAFSPDGRFIVTGDGYDRTLYLWEVATGREVQKFIGQATAVYAATFSPDGRFVITGSDDGKVRLWEISTGGVVRQPETGSSVRSIAFSSDSRLVVTGGWDVRLWEVATGKKMRQLGGISLGTAVTFSPDGHFVAAGLSDKTARLWEVATGKEVQQFDHQFPVNAVAFSPDGRFLLTGSGDSNALSAFLSRRQAGTTKRQSAALLWDVATGQVVREFGSLFPVNSVAFSPDGRFVLTEISSAMMLWDVTTGHSVGLLEGLSFKGTPAVFSPDGQYILTGSGSFWQKMVSTDFTASLYTLAGKEIQLFSGHSFSVNAVAFSPDGRFILTGSGDGTTRLWDARTGRELCRLISFRDGTWVVVDPAGRFDTNNLDRNPGLHWIMPDDPLPPLPLEIFMRDYYEPRLLPRILAGEQFRPVRPLQNLNRVQPKVQITHIAPHPQAPETVSVTVKVAKAARESPRGNRTARQETGIYDLHLFRDGQLVGYAPETTGEIPVDPKTGTAVRTFLVPLPRLPEVHQVEFSAYAFNVDRVKSATDRQIFPLPQPLPPVQGRAYLVTVGVNAYDNPAWDLGFAANDARRIQQMLYQYLARTHDYAAIVPISLLSDYELRDRKRVVTERRATKQYVQTVLDLLAGRPVDAEHRQQIPNGEQIQPARPEDLVLISFSSHGYTDHTGHFYFLLSDIGEGPGQQITAEFLQRALSSEELSYWLRDIDGGEMVLIVDACYAAATVERDGFKPGPMGSRGLGQLAYNKGMRILTASQADDVALESALIQQGLLTYALIQDGLEARQADFQPQDRRILLPEWLRYGVQRVPTLYEEVKIGQVQTSGRGEEQRGVIVVTAPANSSLRQKQALQQPALFDFSRRKREVVLVRAPEDQ